MSGGAPPEHGQHQHMCTKVGYESMSIELLQQLASMHGEGVLQLSETMINSTEGTSPTLYSDAAIYQ